MGEIWIYFKIVAMLGLGIILADRIDIYTSFLIVSSFIILNCSVKLIFKSSHPHRNFLALVFFIGILISQYAQSYEKTALYPANDEFVTIAGYVYDIPQENDGKYTYFIKTDYASFKDKTINAHEIVKLVTEEKLDFARNVTVRGFLNKIPEKMNYSDFDYSLYYKGKGIFYSITDYEIIKQEGYRKSLNPVFISRNIKAYLGKVIDVIASGDDAAVMKAIITGYKKDFSEDYKEILYETNTMRMLYPAYLHISIIMALVAILTSLFSKKVRDYALIFALVMYAFFNCEISIALKCAMFSIITVCVLRTYGVMHYPDILSIVVTLILLFNPLILFEPAFIMSMGAGWMFFMLKDPLNEILGFIKHHKLRKIVVTYIISTFGLLPLMAFLYDGVCIYSLLFSLIIFPLVTVMIIIFPILLLELVVFQKALIAKYAILASLYIIKRIPYIIKLLPFHFIRLPRPNIIFLFIFYLDIILFRRIYYKGIKDIKTQSMGVCLVGLVCSVIITAILNIGICKITFVNVGQGDGIIIELPNGENVVIDGGGSEEFSEYDAGEDIFLPYLKNEGIYRIDLAILTHFHRDHCLGTIAMMKELDVQAVAIADVGFTNEYSQEIESLAKKKGIDIIRLKKGDRIEFDSGAYIKILSPDSNISYEYENDTSLVCELNVNGRKVLFTGDASYNVENLIYDDVSEVDILKVAHHGASSSTSWRFLNKIMPKYSIISVGKNNTYMHPNDDVIKRLNDVGTSVFRTDKNGDVRVRIDKNKNITVDSYYE